MNGIIVRHDNEFVQDLRQYVNAHVKLSMNQERIYKNEIAIQTLIDALDQYEIDEVISRGLDFEYHIDRQNTLSADKAKREIFDIADVLANGKRVEARQLDESGEFLVVPRRLCESRYAPDYYAAMSLKQSFRETVGELVGYVERDEVLRNALPIPAGCYSVSISELSSIDELFDKLLRISYEPSVSKVILFPTPEFRETPPESHRVTRRLIRNPERQDLEILPLEIFEHLLECSECAKGYVDALLLDEAITEQIAQQEEMPVDKSIVSAQRIAAVAAAVITSIFIRQKRLEYIQKVKAASTLYAPKPKVIVGEGSDAKDITDKVWVPDELRPKIESGALSFLIQNIPDEYEGRDFNVYHFFSEDEPPELLHQGTIRSHEIDVYLPIEDASIELSSVDRFEIRIAE